MKDELDYHLFYAIYNVKKIQVSLYYLTKYAEQLGASVGHLIGQVLDSFDKSQQTTV